MKFLEGLRCIYFGLLGASICGFLIYFFPPQNFEVIFIFAVLNLIAAALVLLWRQSYWDNKNV